MASAPQTMKVNDVVSERIIMMEVTQKLGTLGTCLFVIILTDVSLTTMQNIAQYSGTILLSGVTLTILHSFGEDIFKLLVSTSGAIDRNIPVSGRATAETKLWKMQKIVGSTPMQCLQKCILSRK
jgi:hypothetical protein